MMEIADPRSPRSFADRLLVTIAQRIRFGTLMLQLPDGSRHRFRGERAQPRGSIRLHRLRAARRLAAGGVLGFAEAYLDGDWDSDDLPRTLELLALNHEAYQEHQEGRPWQRWLARAGHGLRPNTRRGSRRNILAHYDLGNAFYRHWLDRTMTYSAARFEAPDEPLEQAQQRKLASLARQIELEPAHQVLEIGCGWGSFAEFAAREVGARVTAITISDQQHAYVASRIQQLGLADRVEVRLQDYRDVRGRFDRIASIEMFEAVGERYWPVFFERLRSLLSPSGVAGLQVITIADRYFDAYRRGCDFIQRHVFPGGMLPSPQALEREFRAAGLRCLESAAFGQDYARTLAAWNRRFQAAWPSLSTMGFDERFKRLWEFYLAYCEAGFRAGFTDVMQMKLSRR